LSREPPDVVARRSPWLLRFMEVWFDRFLRRHLNGLAVARWGEPDLPRGQRPLVIYSNHPAWWDGAVYLLLAARLFPGHRSFVPIDAAMLDKYRVFARMGAFAVEPESRRGAAAFLRTAAGILADPDHALWVTAQGRFVDARARPLGLQAGVARLADPAPDALFLPLAIEYAFWTERGAEALVAFGPPRGARELRALPRDRRLALLTDDLEQTMDRLAADVIAREPDRFRPIVRGRAGVGGVYDAWRRLAAALRGRRFDPAHRSRAA
jgi:1-acyl-sn-glycerol-3-phosphate acyltransferase